MRWAFHSVDPRTTQALARTFPGHSLARSDPRTHLARRFHAPVGFSLHEPATPRTEMEAAPGFEPGITDLQSVALPLGHAALHAPLGSPKRIACPRPRSIAGRFFWLGGLRGGWSRGHRRRRSTGRPRRHRPPTRTLSQPFAPNRAASAVVSAVVPKSALCAHLGRPRRPSARVRTRRLHHLGPEGGR